MSNIIPNQPPGQQGPSYPPYEAPPDYQGFVFQLDPTGSNGKRHTLTIQTETFDATGVGTITGTWQGDKAVQQIAGTIAPDGSILFSWNGGKGGNSYFSGTISNYTPGYTSGFLYFEPTAQITGMAPFGPASGFGSEGGLIWILDEHRLPGLTRL
jgi:hypothetical protein